jgi:hypothetical protein
MISATAVGGFNGQISLACTAPAGLTCALSPSIISPGSSAATSTLTVSATSTPPVNGYMAMTSLLPGLGVFGTLFTIRKRKPLARKQVLRMSMLSLLLMAALFTLGCGGNGNSKQSTATATPSQATLTITGTSGSISHSAPVTVTIN